MKILIKKNHLKIKNKKYSVGFDNDGLILDYNNGDNQYTTEDYQNEKYEILNFFRNLKLNDI